MENTSSQAVRISRLSILVNLLLSAGKLAAGLLACAALTACSTAYAATGTKISKGSPEPAAAAEAEETDNTGTAKTATAQDALDAFREALGGKGNTEMKEPRTITVNASGTAKAVPDKAEISFGVTTQAKTPDAAQQENAETIDKVIAHLKERGIELLDTRDGVKWKRI